MIRSMYFAQHQSEFHLASYKTLLLCFSEGNQRTEMADSDAEELSVGAPSPVERNQINHHYYREGDEGRSSGFSSPSSQTRNDVTRGESSSSASQRHPTCALCKNHGGNTPLEGHKRYCPWKDCSCELCYGTKKKRKINANQVASRRAQALDDDRKKKGLPVIEKRITHSPLFSTSSTPGKVRNQQYKNRGRVSPEVLNSRREDLLLRSQSDPSSQIRPTVISCHSSSTFNSSILYGQKLSQITCLLSQSVMVIRQSVCDPTLGLNKLQDLFFKVQDVIKEVNNVSEQLSDIDLDIKRKMYPFMYPYLVNPQIHSQDFLQLSSQNFIHTSNAQMQSRHTS